MAIRGLRDDITVLHVDDDAAVADVTAEHLEREKEQIEARTETDPDAALDRVAEEPIDCVVSDYDMPGTDGVALLGEVRARHGDLPFILYTSKGSEEVASEAISAGVTDYLRKRTGEENYRLLANRIVEAVERQRAETSYREIFENVPDGIVVHDPETGEFLDMNERYAAMYGYDREEFLELGFEAIHPDDAPFTLEEAREKVRAAHEEGPQSFEWLAERRDGESFWARVHLAEMTLHGEDRVVAMVRNIDEVKHRERELRETKDTLEATIDASPDAIMVVDEEGLITMWNPAAERIFGWTEDEVLGEPNPVIPEDRRAEFEDHKERAFSGEPVAGKETKRVTKHGELLDVSLSTAPVRDADGTVIGGMAVIEDITDRKERERELERYERIVENLPVAVYRTDVGGNVLDANPKAMEIIGAESRDEVVGRNVLDLYADPEGRERITEMIVREGEVDGAEVRADTLDGETVWLEIISTAAEEGDTRYFDGIARDVTERKHREQEIERTRSLLSQAQEMADVGGWTFDMSGEPPYVPEWTEKMYDIMGVPTDEEPPTLGELLERYHEEDRERRDAAVEEALERGEGWDVEARIETFDGDTRWVRSTAKPSMEDGEPVKVQGSLQDITERKEREREIERQNEQLEAFAEVVSHDLRNPLNVAQGRLDLARRDGEGGGDGGHLDAVADAHDRIEGLIQDMLALAREDEDDVATGPIGLDSVATDAWDNVPTGDATLETAADTTVVGNRDQVQRMLENLFRNAVTHGGDGITVRVAATSDGFAVEDDGRGFPEDAEGLLELGETTEPTGTGLGLAIVDQVAERHGWEVALGASDEGGARVAVAGVERT